MAAPPEPATGGSHGLGTDPSAAGADANVTDRPPSFTEREFDTADGSSMNAADPRVFERRYSHTTEGLAPPVRVVVHPDDADFGAEPPADRPTRAYRLDDGTLVPIDDGTEPTNGVSRPPGDSPRTTGSVVPATP